MTPAQKIKRAEAGLARLDPDMAQLIKAHGSVVHEPRADYFASLCRSIIGQQVSVAAARAILQRFEQATGMQPAKTANLSEEEARTIGLSRQKSGYLRDLGAHFVRQPGIYNHLEKLEDEEVIAELTEIKGIGVWTAQMFMMFSLGRLDVFAADDIGVQRGMKKLYNWENVPPKSELEKIAEKWHPYRTIACWHLWESLKSAPA